MTQATLVLVSEDTVYRESRTDNALLLFWRLQSAGFASVPQQRLLLQTPPAAPYWMFDTPYEVKAAGSRIFRQPPIVATIPAVQQRFTPPYRWPEVLEEFQRFDHQVYFKIVRPYALAIQFLWYTFEVPDLNDNPWLEWVHPKLDDEAAIHPFRQIPKQIIGQQWNLFWDQPRSPRLEPESDTVRPYDIGVFLIRQTVAIPQPITTCGHIDAYDYGNGSVLLAWPPFQGGLPDSYHIYVNGVLNQSVLNPFYRLAVIMGLFGATTTTPAQTYSLKVVAVSAGVEVAESDTLVTAQPTSVALTTSMKRIWPFPNSGLS